MRFRSKTEKRVSDHLKKEGWDYAYEAAIVPYTVPATPRKYHPDFIVDPSSKKKIKKSLTISELNGKILIEVKGVLDLSERKKFIAIKASNPHLDIRFIFPSDNFLTPGKRKKNKKAGLKYSTWCEKHGFPYYIGETPPPSFFKKD